MKKILPITTVLTQEFIEKHAIPSNIKYGKAICDRGAVEIIKATDVFVEAWVGGLDGTVVEGGGSKRRVEFSASETGVKCNCTGNPKDHQQFIHRHKI